MVCVGVAKFLTHVGIKILDLNGALKSKITTGIESAPTCYISLKLNFQKFSHSPGGCGTILDLNINILT